MTDQIIPINIKLIGAFPEIFEQYKPDGISDEDYVNAIVSSWLIDKQTKDEKK